MLKHQNFLVYLNIEQLFLQSWLGYFTYSPSGKFFYVTLAQVRNRIKIQFLFYFGLFSCLFLTEVWIRFLGPGFKQSIVQFFFLTQ